MREYRTVASPAEAEIVIKKSRFIAQVSPVADEAEAAEFIAAIRKKHVNAAHNCHAYIVDNITQRSSDDGEPSGTAGRPMLEVLRKENLEHTAVVVTRYFGGILLGGGGLIRAYSQATKAGLDAAGMGRQLLFQRLTAVIDYTAYGKLENQLRERKLTVLDTAFTDVVRVELGIAVGEIEQLAAWLTDFCNGQLELIRGEEYYNFVRGI
ncbi:MAG: YigZ family protein [Firmicutes bacterium]|nr:YigZ family protein [Bacillota bacterium]